MLYRYLNPQKYSLSNEYGLGWAGYTYISNPAATSRIAMNASSIDVNSNNIVVCIKGLTQYNSGYPNAPLLKDSRVLIYELNLDGTAISVNPIEIYRAYGYQAPSSSSWIIADKVSANPVNTNTFAISQLTQSYNGTSYSSAGVIVYKSGTQWTTVSGTPEWIKPKWNNTGDYIAGTTNYNGNNIILAKWNGTAITNTFTIQSEARDCWWLGDRLIVASFGSPTIYSIYQRVGDTLVLLAGNIILNTEGSLPSDMVAISNNRFFLAMTKLTTSTTAMLDVTYDGSTNLSSSIVIGSSSSGNQRSICYPVGQNPYIFTGGRNYYPYTLFSTDMPVKKVADISFDYNYSFIDAKAHAPSKKMMILTDSGIWIFR